MILSARIAHFLCRFAAHGEDADGVSDALEAVVAAVVEGGGGGGAGEVADGLRDEDLARGGERADAGGNVDRAAVDVVAFADDVAGVEADVERQLSAALNAAACGFDRLGGGGEGAHDAVAEHLAGD